MTCPHCDDCPTGMSKVKWSSIVLDDAPARGAGSVPSIHLVDPLATLSTSCRPCWIVTVGFAGGLPAGLAPSSAPTRFSHLTKSPGFDVGTFALTFPVNAVLVT